MRRRLLAPLVAATALAAPGPAAAQDRDFTHVPFAARAGGHVSVAFTFRDAARGVRLTFAGRTGRVERVPDTRTAYTAVVTGSRGLRAGRSYRATLSWRDGDGRRRMATRLYVHRRFPGGRG
jgi:hypothetical protein